MFLPGTTAYPHLGQPQGEGVPVSRFRIFGVLKKVVYNLVLKSCWMRIDSVQPTLGQPKGCLYSMAVEQGS